VLNRKPIQFLGSINISEKGDVYKSDIDNMLANEYHIIHAILTTYICKISQKIIMLLKCTKN